MVEGDEELQEEARMLGQPSDKPPSCQVPASHPTVEAFNAEAEVQHNHFPHFGFILASFLGWG